MKIKQKLSKALVTSILCFLVPLFYGCEKAVDPVSGVSSEEAQTAANESTMASQTEEVDDMTGNALSTADSPTGRTTVVDDFRLSCATITFSDSTVNHRTSGRITIDFGTGCTDRKGNVRKGEIIITWSGGRWFMPQSVYVITFSGYSINGVQFSDSDIRTITNISTTDSPLTWTVVANHHLTWPDGSTASREVHHTRQWIRSQTIVDDKFIISQTAGQPFAASGTNRHGKSYTVQITTPLEYDRACAIDFKVFLPVKGVKVITYDNGKTITIDYGDGSCNRSFNVTVSGHVQSLLAKNDGSPD